MSPNNWNIKAPYLRSETIWQRAEEFRAQYVPSGELPINVLEIVEFDLGLEFVPVKDLRRLADISSFLAFDRTKIMIDLDEFMQERFEKRLRFTIAHEVGHYMLHAEVYSHIEINSIEDWLEFQQTIPYREYTFMETHANEFAGRLLVPLNLLKTKFADAAKLLEGTEYGIDDPAAISYIAESIGKDFGVTAQVIARRLRNERIAS
ncbi:ImmA/IrrE family metallo-endopeptidase [Candidatus Obscuribacterales bacterium]|nr:ImmA/IrrE family metallo-endopeptidase [Candidatus Obscuribacterales bacterium]